MVRAGYKQTEVGEIPEDWCISELEHITLPDRPISYGIVQTGPDVFNGVPCLRVVDISDGRIKKDGLITTTSKISNSYKRTKLKKNDLVMPLRGKVGEIAKIEDELVGANLTRGVALIALRNGFDSDYVKQAISSNSSFLRLSNSLNGSALLEMPIATLRSFKIATPSEYEQKAIATALSDVDGLIGTLEKQIAKKRDIKTATMQQLLTGKKRLPGFGEGKGYKQTELGLIPEDWSLEPLGKLLKIRHGKSQKEVIEPDGKYPILATGGEIGRSNIPLYSRPSVLIGRKGTIDIPYYMDTPFWTVDTLFYSEIANNSDAKFLYYKFLFIDWYQYNEASGVPSLNAASIEKILQAVPSCKKEQTTIGEFISAFDIELKALEAKLSKTKSIKQGMMQELLTGRTRLI